MEEQVLEIDSVDELKQILSSVPEHVLVSVTFGEEDATHLVGQTLCDMDREMVCVINLKSDGTPINCNFASMRALDYMK